MTLRAKTVMILGAAFVGLLAVVYVTASQTLLRTFARLENQAVQRSVEGVLDSLAAEAKRADAVALRWANGTQPPPPEAGAAGAGDLRPAPVTDVDFVALIDGAGNVTILAGRAVAAERLALLPGALSARVAGGSVLARHAHTESARTGLIVLPAGIAVVASRPRIDPATPGTIRETVVAGRYLDAEALARLGTAAQVSLSARLLDDPRLPADYKAALASTAGAGRIVVRPLAVGWIAGYRTIEDVDGRPVLVLRVDAPRNVFLQGRASLGYLMVSLVLVAVVFAAVSFLVLDRSVLRRLAWLSANVHQIGVSRSAAARVPVSGGDELAALAKRINEMLDALERVQGEHGESEARYRAVFEQGGDGIVLFDIETGRVLDANRAAQRMLGYSFGELLELRVHDVVLDGSAVVSGHISDVKRERITFAGDAVLRRKDGSSLVGDVTSTLVAMRGREVICSVVRDTSERRRLEERLRQTQKMEAVGRLAAGVAHDFNNLLQSVLSMVGVLRAQGEDAAVRRRVAETLDGQVARGAALTRQLSLVGRQERFTAVPLDLNRMVAEVSEFLGRVMRENVRFNVELAAGELPVLGDRAHLEQSLLNLVANASDAMPAGGSATIRTGLEEGRAWFEVSDHGPGIPPGVRDRIFEPFFTTRDSGQHAGLGLTVVQRIVEEHGGQLVVTSRPNVGSVFRVGLPARAEGEVALRRSEPAGEAQPAGAGGQVLLVEDGEETRRGLAEMLSLLGYSVVAVSSGEEALACPEIATVDLLLTDYMLPGITGAEVARSLLERRPELRVIVMSGYAAEDAIPSDDERVRFLAKPFGMNTLEAEVRAALTRPAPLSRQAPSPSS